MSTGPADPADATPDAGGGYGNAACLDASGWVPSGPESPFTGAGDER